MNRQIMVSGVSDMRHCAHLARTVAMGGLAMDRHSCANRNEAMTTVEPWMVHVWDRTIRGVRYRRLEVLPSVGHGTGGVIVGGV